MTRLFRGMTAGLVLTVLLLGSAALALADNDDRDSNRPRREEMRRDRNRDRDGDRDRERDDEDRDRRGRDIRRERPDRGRDLSEPRERRTERRRESSRREQPRREREEDEDDEDDEDGIAPMVLRLEHISAQSFADTLKQLGRNPELGKALEKIPFAVNEEANAVVIIGPEEVREFIEKIARGLDRASEYRPRRGPDKPAMKCDMPDKKKGDEKPMCPRCAAMKKGKGDAKPAMKCDMPDKKKGDAKPMCPRCAAMEKEKAKPREGDKRPLPHPIAARPTIVFRSKDGKTVVAKFSATYTKTMTAPREPEHVTVARKLTFLPVAEAVGLSAEQVMKVKKALDKAATDLLHLHLRARNAMKDASADEKKRMAPRIEARVKTIDGELRAALLKILSADQRAKVRKMMHPEGGPRAEIHRFVAPDAGRAASPAAGLTKADRTVASEAKAAPGAARSGNSPHADKGKPGGEGFHPAATSGPGWVSQPGGAVWVE